MHFTMNLRSRKEKSIHFISISLQWHKNSAMSITLVKFILNTTENTLHFGNYITLIAAQIFITPFPRASEKFNMVLIVLLKAKFLSNFTKDHLTWRLLF